MISVTGKVIGKKKPLFADFGVDLPPQFERGDGGVTLRDVLDKIVRAQVAAFKQRQQDRQFIRALTEKQIEQQAARGKVESGQSEIKPQEVDEEQAVGAALQAFEDGLYLVILDGEEQQYLDKQVYLKPESKITFVRLTMLAGA
ncbi:MAG: hypothetical protein IT461_06245 [Planctomycetes bacterium]|nr:hypothetical protein [Planctomycetota bacterium]